MTERTVLNDRYQLQERLGAGGMAEVYKAHDLTLERTVALKILRKDFSNNPEFRRRFHQEAKAAANLSHPNIVTVHDFGIFADQIFIVMEYVPGTDLKSLIKKHGKFNLAETLGLMVQACSGIGYAHRSGLVHCDIKPQNMLVTPDMRLKVVDFGIARALNSISADERSDVVWGSPQYFSPEQAAGNAPSPASDVYSLGVVLYEALTGRLPFNGTTAEELARLHREALPPSPRRLDPAIPAALEQVILKILSKEAAARYRSADQLGRVLSSFLTPLPPAPTGPLPPQPGAPVRQNASTPENSRPQTPKSTPALHPSPPHDTGRSHPISRPRRSSEDFAQAGEAVVIEVEDPPELVVISPPSRSDRFDLATWMLALLAILALGGLLPFWIWVIYRINPPV